MPRCASLPRALAFQLRLGTASAALRFRRVIGSPPEEAGSPPPIPNSSLTRKDARDRAGFVPKQSFHRASSIRATRRKQEGPAEAGPTEEAEPRCL